MRACVNQRERNGIETHRPARRDLRLDGINIHTVRHVHDLAVRDAALHEVLTGAARQHENAIRITVQAGRNPIEEPVCETAAAAGRDKTLGPEIPNLKYERYPHLTREPLRRRGGEQLGR